jgi:DDE superfamily endonuclease
MPGPLPAYRPEFPAAFVVQCQQLVTRRTVKYQLRQRARLVLLLHTQPLLSHVEAASQGGLHPDSVRHWRQRWATGEFCLHDELGRGRPPRFSPLGARAGQGGCLRTGGRNRATAEPAIAGRRHGTRPESLGHTDQSEHRMANTGNRCHQALAVQVLDLSRDPHFAEKAGPLLDWYAGTWEGHPLGPKDHILSADEKTSIQARVRCHPTLPSAPDRPAHIEHEYRRGGALQYLAAWDVRRGYVMGRCEPTTGIEPFGRLVHQVLAQEPSRSADRLFWIVDNGSSHRGDTAKHRLHQADSRIQVVHTPVHASWLNQVEIYFSIIQRKVLTPNDFATLAAVQLRLALYEDLSNQCPTPFQWKFDRIQLTTLLAKIEAHQQLLAAAQLHRGEEAA